MRGDNYVALVWGTLWGELPRIIVGGAFFSLLAAPAFIVLSLNLILSAILVGILLVAPAWAALLAYEFPLFMAGSVKAATFWLALRRYWLRSVALGALAAFPLVAGLLKTPLLKQAEISPTLWLSFAADFFVAAFMAALLLYAFPIMVRRNLGLRETVYGAWRLVGRRPVNTVGLLGLCILFGFALAYFSLGLLFLLPAIFGLFVVGNCELVVQQEE